MSVVSWVFILSLAACAYPYVVYPGVLWLWSRFRERPVVKTLFHPTVTMIIPAHNEERLIARKVENTLALDYPPDRLEVLVVSDGSTDETEAIVRSFYDERVRLVPLPPSGKARALNRGALQARGEILAFTDADIVLEPDCLERLVESFADPEVGGVCSNKEYRPSNDGDTTGAGEGLYWRYDKWQKRLESRIGSVFGADGALHAIRRDLYVPIRDTAQADDIAISARVVLQGRRLLFEPRAVTSEEAPSDARVEFRRKVRIANQTFRAIVGLGRELWSRPFYALQIVSHKLLRYLVAFFLLPLFVSSVLLAGSHPLFLAFAGAQAAVYGLGVLGFLLRDAPVGRWSLLALPFFFCFVNLAALLGVLSVVKGRRQAKWASRSEVEVV